MELELENLDINDDPLELDCGDEAEDLTKKLLDEQGKKNWIWWVGGCLVVVFLFSLVFIKTPNCIYKIELLGLCSENAFVMRPSDTTEK